MLENNTVSNSEIKRTSEEEKIEKKREKLKIEAIKADSEEEIKKCHPQSPIPINLNLIYNDNL